MQSFFMFISVWVIEGPLLERENRSAFFRSGEGQKISVTLGEIAGISGKVTDECLIKSYRLSDIRHCQTN